MSFCLVCQPTWTSQDICSFSCKTFQRPASHSEMETRLLLLCRALLFLSACPSCPITPHYSVPEFWTCSWKLLMRAESWEAAAGIFDVLQFVHNSSLLDLGSRPSGTNDGGAEKAWRLLLISWEDRETFAAELVNGHRWRAFEGSIWGKVLSFECLLVRDRKPL